MRSTAALLALSAGTVAAGAIVAFWAWLGAPIDVPPSPLAAGEKLHCISYAPFRPGQTPWMAGNVEPWQIDDDLTRLKPLTDCVRSYSIDHGLDRIPEIAHRHGLKVIHGLWLSSVPHLTREQVTVGIALAKQYPDAIRAIVVGNEVLLRGEMSAVQLTEIIREVRAAVPGIPVTYADVWEFWLRNRDLADVVDFITIHILPYWEDLPIAADQAAAHLDSIRRRVVAAFPGKEVFIGEVGWPSAGRMREGALPSAANQVRMLQDVLTAAKREGYRVNVIEAFDQPWKRQLEGSVGGHWGLFDANTREAKFTWGAPVSNHPRWRWQAGGGVALALLVVLAALAGGRTGHGTGRDWAGVAVMAAASGATIGWAVANVPVESLSVGDWIRSIAWVMVAVAAPVASAAALMSKRSVGSFSQVLARRGGRGSLALGAILLVLTMLAVQAALGLVFDPRYRDFPFAPLTAAVVPFAVLAFRARNSRTGRRLNAETVAAGLLALSAVYIAFNEGFTNWQALWFCAGLLVLTACLWRARGAQG